MRPRLLAFVACMAQFARTTVKPTKWWLKALVRCHTYPIQQKLRAAGTLR
jgi:hypothetical protein